ncbi:MAG: acetylglutamate kinase [Rhodospirillaceae bacterium]
MSANDLPPTASSTDDLKTKDPEVVRAQWIRKAKTLSQALPYMRQFADKTIVVKYGGHAMGDPELSLSFARDVVLLKQVGMNPVVVHGGGPQIAKMLEKLKIESTFEDGLRVTTKDMVSVVEMVLAGSINKEIVSALNQAGGIAIGLSGKDGHLIKARKLHRTRKDPDSNIEKVLDLGYVGEPVSVDPHILGVFRQSDIIPVIAPIGVGDHGETFNINADTAAGSVAEHTKAERLMMLTDIAGVMDQSGRLIPELTVERARLLIADGTISGGMIPKVQNCIDAVERGVGAAVILDGRVPHAILLELFTEGGAGTLIHAG